MRNLIFIVLLIVSTQSLAKKWKIRCRRDKSAEASIDSLSF